MECCDKSAKSKGGCICIIWQPGRFYVNIIEYNAQYIHYERAHNATGRVFYWIVVYGFNKAGERRNLWRNLVRISGNMVGPWIIGVDFNSLINFHEIIGSAITFEEIADFRQCMRACNMNDLSFIDRAFTWSNKQEGKNRVCSKIDRLVGNDAWMSAFPDATITFLPEGCSYHSPCVVNLDSKLL